MCVLRKFFKWLGIVLGGLLGVILLVPVILSFIGGMRLNRTYDVQVENIAIPTEAESIAAGEHWAKTICIGCHQADLSGGPFFEAPFGYFDAANPTPGQGGLGASYSDEDWIRFMRHGLRPDGTPALLMPSHSFWYFSDEDLGELIAYLKSLLPVDQEVREPLFNILGKALLATGMFGEVFLPAEVIAHDTRPDQFPAAGETPEYGEYLVVVSGCQDCHGQKLSGGKSSDPSAILAPNLTPGGELVAWDKADFVKAMREGVTPNGHELDPKQMPWEHYKYFTDEELRAMWLYLGSLPKLQTAVP
jgi:mono/diheme cytochrome c family protein